MSRQIFVFNGDADGLCALQQLRLAEGQGPAEFVTGPKRRIALVGEIVSVSDSVGHAAITVLDLSFQVNAEAVGRLLAAGACVRYFDHHHAGKLPSHPQLCAYIDVSPQVCTSIIVDRYLGGRHRRWAVVGAFGDNLTGIARTLGAGFDITEHDLSVLERLGIALNYNSYAETEAEMFFAPLELHRRLAGHADPLGFVQEDPAFQTLWQGYRQDIERVSGLNPLASSDDAALYVLPDAAWARRVTGVFANLMAREVPDRAHAVAITKPGGGMAVSVRAPLERPHGAATLCLAYATGGGREAAAGINDLPTEELERFAQHFIAHFRK